MKKGIITEDDKISIVNNYLKGNSIIKLSRFYHVDGSRIREILINHNITIRNKGQQVNRDNYITTKKYTFNESYFKDINTDDKSYWLGFLYADGSVYFKKKKNGNSAGATIEISLKKEDEYQLYNFNSALNGNIPIKDKLINLNNKIYKACRISLSSIKMADDLVDKGCVPNKSLILTFPNFLENKLIPHFIRGYFDGDGSVYFYKNKPNKGFGACILGTLNLLEGIKHYLLTENINSISIYNKNNIYELHIFGIDNLNKFFNLIYYDKCFFLERKYKIFLDALKYYNKDYYVPEIEVMVSQMDWSD